MRRPVIAGNWKMHKTSAEAEELARALVDHLSDLTDDREVVLCPPFTGLKVVFEVIKASPIKLGAQNLHWEKSGAFTGEISAVMLKDVGCSYVIIGHSERRTYFYETNATVNKKIFAALDQGLIPIVCVGETLEEREKNQTFEIIERQIKEGLVGLAPSQALRLIIAYEPVWAIGTGKTATPEQANEVHTFIRYLLAQNFNEGVASEIRIQYGGSVRPDNIKSLMNQKDIDGVLVGGASLDADSFTKIVKFKE
jgi:triosephosphate isomerase